MKIRIFLWSLVLLALLISGAFILYWQRIPERLDVFSEEEIADAVKKLGGVAEPPTQTVVRLLDLKLPVRLAIGNLGLADDNQNRRLGDLVLANLSGARGLNLVERQAMDQMLREMKMNLSGLVRAKDAMRVGRLLKADWFLLGTEAKINGSDSIVIRVVDARTGTLCEAGVFSGNEPSIETAKKIAEFVRQCRQDAAIAKPRAYLALGTFDDLSLNNRQSAFPTQLRSYLTTSYQGGNVTFLEREFVNTLLEEMRLDLVGLTEEGITNVPSPMQSAFWLVDGYYQSYETTNYQVELVLNVTRMFGRTSQTTFRGLPDETLFQRIKSQIDTSMEQIPLGTKLSSLNEVRVQIVAGERLAGLTRDTKVRSPELYQNLDEQETARRRRNVQEGIRAFETVLLLDPENREAKMCLAACLRNQVIGRAEQARDLYREILESPVQDKWTRQAQDALSFSFEWESDEEVARWFERVAQQTSNPFAVEFYRKKALNPKKPGETLYIKLAVEDVLQSEQTTPAPPYAGIPPYTAKAEREEKYVAKPEDEKKVAQAFALLDEKQWQQALEIFETFSNMPVLMSTTGPWGHGWLPVLPSKEVAYCRAKLGLPEIRNPMEFDMGKPIFCLCTPSTFTTDIDGVWIGINGQLMHLDFDLKTNLVVDLPMDSSTPVTSLCLTSSNIWIGTGGDGLIEFDKTSRECRHLTVKDGLLMEVISCLYLSGDSLWIGFGGSADPGRGTYVNSGRGGLGYLSLSTRRFTSFTPPLAREMMEILDKPPQDSIRTLVAKSDEEAWFFPVRSGILRHFLREEVIWDAVPQMGGGSCLAVDAEHVYSGQYLGFFRGGTRPGPLGLNIISLRDRQWRRFTAVDGLPSELLCALTLDGKYLWVGGMGYIALLDPKEDQVLKLTYIHSRDVNKIQVGGGYIWAQFDWHLYRAPLADIYPK